MILHSDIVLNDEKDEKDENDEEIICMVCHDNLNNEVKLKCGHKFHYDCIFSTYKSNNNKRDCPYCRRDGGFLKLKDGMIPFLNIHKEFKDYINGTFNLDSINYVEGKCKKILKTGKNQGTQCRNKYKPNESFCGKHL
jgi:hypothetical protein